MTTPHVDRHLDEHASDGVLLALHDKQHDSTLDVDRRHVENCDDCRARLAIIAVQSNHLRDALTAIWPSPIAKDDFRRRLAEAREQRHRPVWRRPAWLAAAAVILLGGAAAASPIRQWVRRHLATTPQRHASPEQIVVPKAVPVERSGATVSFHVSGPGFTIRFDSTPATGALTVKRASADQVSARVASGAGTGGDALVVLPNELLVRNTGAARASYELTLPAAVSRFRVIVAGRIVFDGAPPATIPLVRSR